MKKSKLLALAALASLGLNANAQETLPDDGGTYYVYNKEAGAFLTRGSCWGTRGYVNTVAIPFAITKVNDGTYKFEPADFAINKLNRGLTSNGYVDTSNPGELTVSGTKDAYTIGLGDKKLHASGNLKNVNFVEGEGSNWQFFTQAQYDAKLASLANTQNIAAATSAGVSIPEGKTLEEVLSANYSVGTKVELEPASGNYARIANWTVSSITNVEGTGEARGAGLGDVAKGVESFQGGGIMKRTVKDLSKGLYKVYVKGSMRATSNANCVTMANNGIYQSDAYAVINGNIVPIKAWARDKSSNDAPNSPAAVAELTEQGKYTTSSLVYVGDDGKLDIEINATAWWNGESRWFMFVGVDYAPYSDEVDAAAAEQLINTANGIKDKEMNATVKSNLTGALSAISSSATIATYNALNDAVSAANTSIQNYSNVKVYANPELDEAGLAKYKENTKAATLISTYANKSFESITDADLTSVKDSYVLGIKAQTTVGTELKLGISDSNVGWEGTNPTSGYNTWSSEFDTDEMKVPYVQYWQNKSNGAIAAGDKTYTITNLVPGQYYTVSATVRAMLEGNNSTNVSGLKLIVGDNVSDDLSADNTQVVNGASANIANVNATDKADEDGKLVIGLRIADANYNWAAIKDVKVVVAETPTVDPYIALFESLKTNNSSLKDEPMNSTVKSELEEALGANPSTGEYQSAYNTLDEKVSAAKASIKVYEQIDAINTKAEVLDEAGQAAYKTTKTAYENGTLSTVAEAEEALIAAAKAQTSADADMTLAIANPNFDGNINGWNDEFSGTLNHGFQNNSTYGTINQFMECWAGYWSGAAEPYVLPNGKLSQVITGLPAGKYTLTADVIATQQQAGQDGYVDSHDNETGIYLFAGETKSNALSIEAGAANHSVSVEINFKGGDLEIGIMADNTNCNWMVMDNVTLKLTGVYEEPVSTPELTITDGVAIEVSEDATYNVTYKRTFNAANKWQSLVLPFDFIVNADMLDDVVMAQITSATINGEELTINIKKLAAGDKVNDACLPLFIAAKKTGTFDIPFGEVTVLSYTEHQFENGGYVYGDNYELVVFPVLTGKRSGIAGSWVMSGGKLCTVADNSNKLGINRWYMKFDDSEPCAKIRIVVNGLDDLDVETTAIAEAFAEAAGIKSYTISGANAKADAKGIVIINGKKTFVK